MQADPGRAIVGVIQRDFRRHGAHNMTAETLTKAIMRTLTTFGLMVACIGCSTPSDRSDQALVPFQTFYPLEHATLSYQVPTRFEKAITDTQEWEALWREIQTHSTLQDEENTKAKGPPRVDFRRQTLLVVATGNRPSGGFSVGFRSVREYESHIEVTAYELRPLGNECVAIAVVTYPAAFALIPHTKKPVRFQRDHADLTCGR